jgi:hypothetical protein
MAVLLLFNEIDCLTVETILDQTQIENDLSRQVILSLLKSKVLICPQITADQLEKDLKDNDIKHDYTIRVDQRFTRFNHCSVLEIYSLFVLFFK